MVKKDINLDPPYLDEEEQQLIEGYESALKKGKVTSRLTTERKADLEATATNTMSPPKVQITTRLAKPDLSKLKVMAMEQGLPYQTLLASIVHRYVDGRLVDKG